MARWQRFNPEALKRLREELDLSPERLALRLRVWELVDLLNQCFPGAGVVVLQAFLGKLDVDDRVRDETVRGLEQFLKHVLVTRFKKQPRPGITGYTIRRWEQGGLPMTSNLHALFDCFNFNASDLFEPSVPGPPKVDPEKAPPFERWLKPQMAKFREDWAARPRPRRGRPPMKKKGRKAS